MQLYLSGTAASGKDTISRLLEDTGDFSHFKKHRAGDGGSNPETYHQVGTVVFKEMAARGEFLQHHERYGRMYGVSKKVLANMVDKGVVPIIHVGRLENLLALQKHEEPSVSVLLYCGVDETLKRLNERHKGDMAEVSRRLEAYAEERAEFEHSAQAQDVMINTENHSAEEVANIIYRLFSEKRWGEGDICKMPTALVKSSEAS